MKVVYVNNEDYAQKSLIKEDFQRVKYRSRFLVNSLRSLVVLRVLEIAYFVVTGEILYAITYKNMRYHINMRIRDVAEELDPDIFRRVNRQVIININSIRKIEPYFQGKIVINLIIEHSQKIIVSKNNAKAFKEWIDS